MKSTFGITRVDQSVTCNLGFLVRITHNGRRYQKYFPDKACGGRRKALAKAKEYRDSVVAKFPKYNREAIARRRRKVKQCDVAGVTHAMVRVGDKTYEYWQAFWRDAGGHREWRRFSVERYGEERALEMAKKAVKKGHRGQR